MHTERVFNLVVEEEEFTIDGFYFKRADSYDEKVEFLHKNAKTVEEYGIIRKGDKIPEPTIIEEGMQVGYHAYTYDVSYKLSNENRSLLIVILDLLSLYTGRQVCNKLLVLHQSPFVEGYRFKEDIIVKLAQVSYQTVFDVYGGPFTKNGRGLVIPVIQALRYINAARNYANCEVQLVFNWITLEALGGYYVESKGKGGILSKSDSRGLRSLVKDTVDSYLETLSIPDAEIEDVNRRLHDNVNRLNETTTNEDIVELLTTYIGFEDVPTDTIRLFVRNWNAIRTSYVHTTERKTNFPDDNKYDTGVNEVLGVLVDTNILIITKMLIQGECFNTNHLEWHIIKHFKYGGYASNWD